MKQLSVKIDNHEYVLDFLGFSQPLKVKLKTSIEDNSSESGDISYRKLSIEPWTLGQYIQTLEDSFYWENNQGRLDTEAYALAVLGQSNHQETDGNYLKDFMPIALWWASGGYGYQEDSSLSDTQVVAGEWLPLDSAIKVKLRTWTMAECLSALDKALQIEQDAPQAFNIVNYLQAMLDACVVVIRPDLKLDLLDASAARILLDYVLHLNCADANKDSDKHDTDYQHSSSLYIQKLMRDMAEKLDVDLQTMLSMQGKEIEKGLNLKGSHASSPDMIMAKVNHGASHLAQYQDAVVINIG